MSLDVPDWVVKGIQTGNCTYPCDRCNGSMTNEEVVKARKLESWICSACRAKKRGKNASRT